jgi:hypothetical protein
MIGVSNHPHQEEVMITRIHVAAIAAAAIASSVLAVAPSASARITAPAGSFLYS